MRKASASIRVLIARFNKTLLHMIITKKSGVVGFAKAQMCCLGVKDAM